MLKTLKYIFIVFGSLITIFLALFLILQLPVTQKYLTQKLESTLTQKLNTKVEIGEINLAFPKSIFLGNIFLEDQKKDTLWYSKQIKIDINLTALINQEIIVNSFLLEGVTSNIERAANQSSFNFDFISEAFNDTISKEDMPEPDTTANNSSWKISVYNFKIQDLKVWFKDAQSGMQSKNKIGLFHLNHLRIDSNLIDIGKIKLNKSYSINTQFAKSQDPQSPKQESTSNTKLIFAGLEFENINLVFNDQLKKTISRVDLGDLNLSIDEFDLKNQVINMNGLGLKNTLVSFVQSKNDSLFLPTATNPKEENNSTLEINIPWKINLRNLVLTNNSFKISNENHQPQENKFDPNHIAIKNFNLNIPTFSIENNNISTLIQDLSFNESSGFSVNNFSTGIEATNNSFSLKDFHISTPHSIIKNNLSLSFNSIDSLIKDPLRAKIKNQLYETEIGLKDLLFFSPEMKEFSLPFSSILELETSLSGKIAELKVEHFNLKTFNNSQIKLKGGFKGLNDIKKLTYDFEIQSIKTIKNDILKVNPLLSNLGINLPDYLEGTASIQGTTKNIKAATNINSNLGKVNALLTLGDINSKNLKYSGDINLTEIKLGELLNKREELGLLSASFNLTGKGTNPNSLNAKIYGLIKELEFNKYNFKNINLNAEARNSIFSTTSSFVDKNLDYSLNANFNSTNESSKFELNLNQLNLMQLGFSEKDIVLKGKLTAFNVGVDLNKLTSSIKFSNITLKKEGNSHIVDKLNVNLKTDSTKTEFVLYSSLIAANFEGNFGINQGGQIFNETLAPYFNLNNNQKVNPNNSHHFTFNLSIPQPEMLEETFIPDLKEIELKTFNASYSGENKRLNLNLDIPKIIYAQNNLDSVLINLRSVDNTIVYDFKSSNFNQPNFSVPYPELNGKIENNTIWTNFFVRDINRNNKFQISSTIEKLDTGYNFKFVGENLLLNFKKWSISPNNRIFIKDDEFQTTDLKIKQGDQLLEIKSTGKKGTPITINFDKFQLSTFTKIIETTDSLDLNGILSGELEIENIFETPLLKTEIHLKEFAYGKDTLGNIDLKAHNKNEDLLAFDLRIKDKGNKVSTKGTYNIKSDSILLDLSIPNFKLVSLQPYLKNELKDLSGLINGNINVKGPISTPIINGKLNFSDSKMHIIQTNSSYRLKNESIIFNDNRIQLDNFRIIDEKNNLSKINGSIIIQKDNLYLLDLKVDADNFQLLNTSQKDNNIYYGSLLMQSHLKITGNNNKPKINATLKVLEGSSLTYVVPETEEASFEYNHLIEFVDFDSLKLIEDSLKNISDTISTEVLGANLNASLEIDKTVKFKIIIDPNAGDYLEIVGKALLSFSMDPSGNMALSGIYEISDGAYELTYYNFLKRKFSIQPGSNISWNGDPFNAHLNIKTKYVVKTAPLPLVSNQTSKDPEELRAYKKSIPFEVFLNVQNELTEPEINFELGLPDQYKSFQGGAVQAKLNQLNQQPSELNKQVFSLLMLNRFIPESSQTASSSGGVSGSARSSVSKVISQQLNALSGKYIKGVNLNFDLDSYNDLTGDQPQGRTELKLELSKELFNDKLIVSLGGNLDLEGERRGKNNAGNLAQDVSFEYKINENGTYRLKGYRQNQFEGIIDGDLTKTGIAFIFTRDYNKLSEIFRNQEKKKKKK